jgi:hypothetical protein
MFDKEIYYKLCKDVSGNLTPLGQAALVLIRYFWEIQI